MIKKNSCGHFGENLSKVVICKNPVFFTISVIELHLVLEGFIYVCV